MQITRILFILLISLGVVFAVHVAVLSNLGLEPLSNRIVLAYAGNLVLTAAIVIFLSRLPDRFTHSLGYLFLFGSAIKFVFFFVFFFPFYRLDGDISKQEFITFFVPYAVCLILETKLLVSWLNAQDKNQQNT